MRYTTLLLFTLCPVLLADEPKKKEEAYAIAVAKADKLEFKPGEFAKPTVIGTEKDAVKLIADETTRKRILSEVDLQTHDLIVFAWEGSGQDKIDMLILESFPVQYRFKLKLGATDDLRMHVAFYAMKKGANWSAK